MAWSHTNSPDCRTKREGNCSQTIFCGGELVVWLHETRKWYRLLSRPLLPEGRKRSSYSWLYNYSLPPSLVQPDRFLHFYILTSSVGEEGLTVNTVLSRATTTWWLIKYAFTIEIMIFRAKWCCIHTMDRVQTVQLADEMPQSCRESL